MDEPVLILQGEYDDLFEGLQTLVEGRTSYPPVLSIQTCAVCEVLESWLQDCVDHK
jgi:hypothetical protein